MKGLEYAVAFIIAAHPVPGGAQTAPLTPLHSIVAIPNAQASKHPPVSFAATVTYYRSYDKDLFVQDGSDAIYVHAPTNLELVPGDRIVVRGTMHESFRPYVDSQEITRTGSGKLPKPAQPTFQQMIHADTDCKYVTVRALVRSADLVPNPRSAKLTTYLRMLADGGPVDATIDSDDVNALGNLLDAEVQVTGAVAGHFDNKMQLTGILIHVQSMDGVKILKRSVSDPWSLPITPMDRIISGYRPADMTQRTRVKGTITYYQPGSAVVLQDGTKSLWIKTDSWTPLRLGDKADVVGFPTVDNGFLSLNRGEIRDSGIPDPIPPALLDWRDLSVGGNDGSSRAFDLVSMEGQVVTEVRQSTQDEYVISSDGHLFSAILRHPNAPHSDPLPAMRQIPGGARIRVTGICMMSDANPFNGEVPFNILMRNTDDITIVSRPPWMNVRNLMLIVGLLFAFVIALGVWAWYVERRNRREIGSLAYLERRRSRILEDINHSKPLAGILERITELVSVRLNGAPCWCKIADGTMMGNRPEQLNSPSLRTVENIIAARTGPALGTIYAAFDARIKPSSTEKAALAMAAELSTLAIETSRLYSDLVHRSEFDILTDVQNRFAVEKTLRLQIQAAHHTAGIFGLIYIDLNEFKQVNDVYGHQVGDLYLQEVTRRMKHQLRPSDTLARLGGDEFAVVVAEVRNRGEVEEIAARLESAFDQPFEGEGYSLRGSASFGIALYPEDADNVDNLLRAADVAMYIAKYTRAGRDLALEGLANSDLPTEGQSEHS